MLWHLKCLIKIQLLDCHTKIRFIKPWIDQYALLNNLQHRLPKRFRDDRKIGLRFVQPFLMHAKDQYLSFCIFLHDVTVDCQRKFK